MHEWIIIKRATDEFSCIISPSCYWTGWSTREMERRGSKRDKRKKKKRRRDRKGRSGGKRSEDSKVERKRNSEDMSDKGLEEKNERSGGKGQT